MSDPNQRRPLRVAAAQFHAETGDIAANVVAIAKLIDEAGDRQIDVVVFPELAVTGYDVPRLIEDPGLCAVDPAGEALQRIGERCRARQVVAVVGACLQRASGVTNSVIIWGRDGRVLATTDKRYLDGMEKRFFVPGGAGCMIEVDGWKLAVGICYDASFPEFSRAAALAGADAFLFCGAFLLGASDHRRSIYFPARALENTSFVVFSNFIGRHADMDFCGRSAVYGPDGRPLAELDAKVAGLTTAELSYETLLESREGTQMLRDYLPPGLPFVRHRAPDRRKPDTEP